MDPALLKAQNLGSSQGMRDQQRRELLHALLGHAYRPAGDAYRGDDLSVMVADRRADAADSFFVLDVVHRQARLPDPGQLSEERLPSRDGPRSPPRESAVVDIGVPFLLRPAREQNLAQRGGVAGAPGTDPRCHLHRAISLDLVDVDEVEAVEDAEVHGLAGRAGEIIENRMDDPVDLQALDDLRGDLYDARGQRVGSVDRILTDVARLDQGAGKPVGGALVETESLGHRPQPGPPGL